MSSKETKKIVKGTKKPSNPVMQYIDRCDDLSGPEEFHQIMGEAANEYISGKLSIEQLHNNYPKVPAAVFRGYVKDMGWDKLRDENMRAVHVAAALDYLTFVHENRKKVSNKFVTNFLPTLDGFKNRLDVALEHGSTTDIRRLTESIKYIMDVLSTTVGINGTVPDLTPDAEALLSKMSNAPMPLFDITMTGPITVNPDPSEAKAVDHLKKVHDIDEE